MIENPVYKREFKVGDTVTFKPYEKEVSGKVTKVFMYQGFSQNEWELNYEIKGVGILTKTSPRCIKESVHFETYTNKCLGCGKKFEPQSSIQEHCSSTCQIKDWSK